MTSRREQRKAFSQQTRLSLLEDDADECEGNYNSLISKLDSARNRLTGILIGIIVGNIAIFWNLLASKI